MVVEVEEDEGSLHEKKNVVADEVEDAVLAAVVGSIASEIPVSIVSWPASYCAGTPHRLPPQHQ